jgi:hypothetical protein
MMSQPLPLPPNAALEAAAVEMLRAKLGYKANECDRTHDGRPGARGGQLFVGVWSDGQRSSGSRVALDERFGIAATVTIQIVEPDDRAWQARDRMEREVNRVRAVLHGDTWGHELRRRANELAGLGDAATRNVGFCEALYLLGIDAWQDRGGDWFLGRGDRAGVSQTIRLGGARLIQAVPTAR